MDFETFGHRGSAHDEVDAEDLKDIAEEEEGPIRYDRARNYFEDPAQARVLDPAPRERTSR